MLIDENIQKVEDLSLHVDSFLGKGENAKQMAKEKHLKILIIAPTLDVFLGGQAVQSSRLMEKLNCEPNIQVDIQSIAPQFLPKLQKIKYLRTILRGVKYLFDIFTKIPRYDIIHICSAAHFSFLLAPTPAVLVAKLFGKKTILNYRSGQLKRHYENWQKTLKPTLKLFDKIVTPSHYLVDVFREFGFEAEAIFNFVDVEKFKFKERKHLCPIFLSNRLLEELYNIPCILRAFKIIQQNHPEAKLIVASFGDQRENLENYAKELNLKNVEFVGKLPQKKMAELYGEIDVYLNSPNTDNMPGSIIECYASGVPVVTTNAGGIPYILEDEKTGLMVKVNDHEALANEAMRLLEDNELAQKLIKNGREAVKKYSWKKVRKKWLKAYEEVLENK